MELGVTSEGERVAEAELAGDSPASLVEAARTAGAALVWVHANDDLSRAGFLHEHGFVRLHTDATVGGAPLPELAPQRYAPMLDAAYRGLWGHKLVASDASPPLGAIVLALVEDETPVGICTVLPAERLVDGPGVIPAARSVERYRRLLEGACAALGPGAADIVSWGDPPEVLQAYVELGFDVAERTGGWTLRL